MSPAVRILVVDDDAVTCRALCGAVQVVFEKPDVARDGDSAVLQAQQNPYDMIFMDVRMPGMDGFAACAKIRETSRNRETPVVFVTSHSDRQSREQSQAAGCSGFIPKPALRMEVTLTALTFALRRRLQVGKANCCKSEAEFKSEEHITDGAGTVCPFAIS